MRTDYVQRFLFEHLDIRGRLVCLTDAWSKMTEGRGYPPQVTELLGHSTALAALLGANQKNDGNLGGRVTLQVQGAGPVKLLVADCAAGMKIRGMAQYLPEARAGAGLLGAGKLAVTLEDGSSGQIYQSFVPLEGASLAENFEHYLAQSEQLTSFLRLHASGDAICGLLLEKLPGADARDSDGWNRVTHLAATLGLEETMDAQPYDLLVKLFPEELLRVFPLDPVAYHCPFDVQNVERVLRGLGREEVESILAERGEVVIKNEMCNHEYRFDRAAVETLFA
ncbi:MAG: Hsp33 family molecular chaperone HslO [Betaproteobacteria bacterium]